MFDVYGRGYYLEARWNWQEGLIASAPALSKFGSPAEGGLFAPDSPARRLPDPWLNPLPRAIPYPPECRYNARGTGGSRPGTIERPGRILMRKPLVAAVFAVASLATSRWPWPRPTR